MTITIPAWLLWTLGVAGGVVVLLLAIVGGWFMWSFRGGLWR